MHMQRTKKKSMHAKQKTIAMGEARGFGKGIKK